VCQSSATLYRCMLLALIGARPVVTTVGPHPRDTPDAIMCCVSATSCACRARNAQGPEDGVSSDRATHGQAGRAAESRLALGTLRAPLLVAILATISLTSVYRSWATSYRQTGRWMATSSTVISGDTRTRSAGNQSSALIVLIAMTSQTSNCRDGCPSGEHRYSRSRIASACSSGWTGRDRRVQMRTRPAADAAGNRVLQVRRSSPVAQYPKRAERQKLSRAANCLPGSPSTRTSRCGQLCPDSLRDGSRGERGPEVTG
jgi:hypothetical protein